MKKKGSLLTVIGIVVALTIGFLIGISVNFPKVDNNELAGTIGKTSKYRNVMVTEPDIQLRSDLLADTSLQKAYIEFYSFHYATAVELTNALELAINASENLDDFKSANASIVSGLKKYRTNIDRMRADLLLAVATFNKIEGLDAASLNQVINNANIALAQLSYNDDAVLAFVDESAVYITGKADRDVLLLRKAHDKLMLLQITKAIVMNDKPKIKYLDGKELFAANEQLNIWSNESLNGLIIFDQENLNMVFNNEQLGVLFSQESFGVINSNENFKAISENLGAIYFNFEQLGLYNSEKLGTLLNVEQLGTQLMNIESLGSFRNVEQLGIIIPT
ncbi:MAG TPA: hypothetical protein PLF35_04720 [Prolixibacteraceae bacterium]|nr:hypothetical protein [Prolixibacteraceae bacterium]